jgi:hypothetical protein
MTASSNPIVRLCRDTRGGTDFIELLILVTVVALGGIAAFGPLRDAIVKKASDTATQIEGIK